MAVEVKMPKFGETMTEGTINRWLKKEGEEVKKDEPLFEIETDKANLEVESPESGILAKIIVQEYETASIGDVIALIAKEGEDINDLEIKKTGSTDTDSIEKSEETKEIEDVKKNLQEAEEVVSKRPSKIKASPAAKRLAGEEGIDLSLIKKDNDEPIVEKDVLEFLESKKSKTDITPEATSVKVSQDEEVPLTGIRKVVAQRMIQSSKEAPQVTLTTKVNMEELVLLRKRLLDLSDRHITYTDFLTMAAVKGLKQYPKLNAHINNDSVVYKENINIGIAVDINEGLVVPVIKNAEKLGLESLAEKREVLIEKARNRKLAQEDLEGGTFTVTNLGNFGIEIFTPIINPPEVAILGVGKISKEPVVINDEIVIKPMLWLSLTFDHRALDGAPAAEFLNQIKELLENPEKMLLV